MSNSSPDQIDLRSFLNYLEGFKSFVLSSFRFLWNLVRKKVLWLLIPVILFVVIGYIRHSQEEPVFNIEMQLTYNELHKMTYGEMILRLQDQIEEENISWVADVLLMDPEEVMFIKEVSALNIGRSPLHEDVSMEKLPFYVLAKITDRTISDKLQAGIIQYLKSNPLNLERRRINLQNMKDRMNFLEKQLAWMDSIKVNYNKQLKAGIKPEPLANEMSIDKLFSLSDTFYQEWLSVRSGLQSYEAVELIFGFNPGPKASKAALLPYLIKYALMGLAISFMLLLWFAIPTRKQAS